MVNTDRVKSYQIPGAKSHARQDHVFAVIEEAVYVLNSELLDIPLLILSGCFVAILVLVSTSKRKAKQ